MNNFGCIKYGDFNYPKQLKSLSKPPKQLFYNGNLDCLNDVLISFVGTRRASQYGKYCSNSLIEELSLCGVTVVSGLASGIDTLCHKAALNHRLKTIAVFGTPLNTVFPKENESLVKEIISKGGLVLSEYSPDTLMQKYFFPERNRIVAALSLATVIVEAPQESGALLTAHIALELGRDVYAVPADINSSNSAGCNNLIKNSSAKAITCGADIIEDLRLQPSIFTEALKNKENKFDFDDDVKKVYLAISATRPTSIEKIMKETGFDIQTINKSISLLEINFLVASLSTGAYLKMK